MSSVEYTYSIKEDTANKLLDNDSLEEEIRASDIVTALDYIQADGDDLGVWFKASLSSGDETILDGVIAEHTGEPIAEDPTDVVLSELDHTTSEKALKVAPTKLEGSSTLLVSHDWCDRTTWWTDSVRVLNETLDDSGNGIDFTSPNNKVNWIDLVSGKVAYEDNWADDYRVLVYVDDELVTEGFTIDYALGKITFDSAQTGKTVKATYSYENGSTWKISPESGKILKILGTTIKYSENVSLSENQHFSFQLFAGDTPYLPPTLYKQMKNFMECAVGDVRHVPAHGDIANDMIELDFDYMTSKDLTSVYGLNIRVKVSNDEPIGGEWACVQAKCLSLDV